MMTKLSYRDCTAILNRVMHRDEGELFHHRTIADHAESVGLRVSKALSDTASTILCSHAFDPDTAMPLDVEALPSSITKPKVTDTSDEQWNAIISDMISTYNIDRPEEEQICDIPLAQGMEALASETCMISIDDVGVRHQKDERKGGGKKERKFVENTVIHIQADSKAYVITAVGMERAFRLLVAFLLENHLMENRHLIFFSDGAQNIRANIDKYFGYRPYSLILDWYHLVKRIRELSSMAFKMNKEKKQETIRKILRILWPGNVDKAIDHIRNLPDKSIKNKYYVEEMMSYLERKKPNITCHAARRSRNLRISSNTSEKANDCLVAQRQKHNGMSWSFEGSGALALLTTLKMNNTLDSWLHEGKFSMSLKSEGRVISSIRAA
ncbi:MAG: hypothetical protein JEY71_03435 [Sphaerochaeta sp.]|nr:hypothetical protein [Sphaerochaeta sp.]